MKFSHRFQCDCIKAKEEITYSEEKKSASCEDSMAQKWIIACNMLINPSGIELQDRRSASSSSSAIIQKKKYRKIDTETDRRKKEKGACKAWCLIILLSLVTSVWCKSLMNVDQNPFWFGAHYLFIHLDGFPKSGDSPYSLARALYLSSKTNSIQCFVYTIYFIKTHKRLHGISGVWDHWISYAKWILMRNDQTKSKCNLFDELSILFLTPNQIKPFPPLAISILFCP